MVTCNWAVPPAGTTEGLSLIEPTAAGKIAFYEERVRVMKWLEAYIGARSDTEIPWPQELRLPQVRLHRLRRS